MTVRVLAVSADDARHAPVRALLRTEAIEHVTTPDAAVKAATDRGVTTSSSWTARSTRPAPTA